MIKYQVFGGTPNTGTGSAAEDPKATEMADVVVGFLTRIHTPTVNDS